MLIINNNSNKIYLTKNDNADIQIEIYDADGNRVEIKPEDELKLTVKNNTTNILVKIAEDGVFKIVPQDTANINAGIYLYDIQYQSDSWTETVVTSALFEVGSEISE